MWEDPIIKELHETRKAMLAEFDGDFRAFFEYLRDEQVKNKRKIVKPPPRKKIEPS